MNKLYILGILGCLLLTACEDLVEVDNPSNLIGTIHVFEDSQTADAALAGLYTEIRDASLMSGAGYYSANSLLAAYADDLDYFTNDQNGVMDIHLNQPLEANTIIASLWNSAYKQIYYSNSVIYGAEHSKTLPKADKNRIKGEALLVRSLIYYYLQQLFGDVPYTTSLNYEYNRTIGKTNSAALLEQLEVDLKEAVGLLTDDYRDAERIYPNRKVAQLLLAKVYLLRENWPMAEETVETVLSSPLYGFEPDIDAVFHKDGRHILWQLKPQNSGDPTREATFYYFANSSPNSFVLTPDLLQSFADEDLRKQSWMEEATFNEESWFRPYKYKNRSNNTNEYSVVFRLAGAYFIIAEALARQDRFVEALPFLNATRERAGLNGLSDLYGQDFFDALSAEKRREFFTEGGQRFMDLKRWGRLGDLSAQKTNWEAHNYVWPLPQGEMLLNPNLKPQNQGY
jgi:hypothetical protein